MSDKMKETVSEPMVTDRFVKTKKKYYLYGVLLLAVLLVVNVVVYVLPMRYTAELVMPVHPNTLSIGTSPSIA